MGTLSPLYVFYYIILYIMRKMLGQISDCNPKAIVYQTGAKEVAKIESLRIHNADASASTITVYVSESAATSGAGNVVYYTASLAANTSTEITGISLGYGQKLEVLSGAAANVVASAFGEAKTDY